MASLDSGIASSAIDFCVQLYETNYWHFVVEATCVAIIVYLLSRKSYKKEDPLTEAEIDDIIDAWTPEPLIPTVKPEDKVDFLEVESAVGPRVSVKGETYINFANDDFLSLNGNKRITEKALETIDNYGVGSCGPRGFYGSIDVHLHLEEKIAKFLGTPKAIIFGSDIATASSTIPAFSKAGDVIFCDEAVGFSFQEGCRLSKSEVVVYRHNDMQDLETKLIQWTEKFEAKHKKNLPRKFIAFEAMSGAIGDVAPLKRLVELKHKFKFRLIMDESYSIGVLGESGKGLTEATGVPVSEIDIILASMAHSIAAIGGVCAGPAQVVDFQRLTASGYVFSASSPPYLSVAAMEALDIIEGAKEQRKTLKESARFVRSELKKVIQGRPFFRLLGDEDSPIVVLSLPADQPDSKRVARALHKELLKQKVIVFQVLSALGERRVVAGLRIHLNSGHTKEDLQALVSAVAQSLEIVVGKGL
eukprot:c1852_g1_i1.p1 GENE.c1852_g1_i1~~c1852_g1_i1.p1  ORF type:complete len:485 (+),score=88.34 c1852_g1_i1:35-1456(+)